MHIQAHCCFPVGAVSFLVCTLVHRLPLTLTGFAAPRVGIHAGSSLVVPASAAAGWTSSLLQLVAYNWASDPLHGRRIAWPGPWVSRRPLRRGAYTHELSSLTCGCTFSCLRRLWWALSAGSQVPPRPIAVTACLVDCQLTAAPASIMTYPVTLLLVSGSPA
eukprot:466850-Rhodomonas_salina.1